MRGRGGFIDRLSGDPYRLVRKPLEPQSSSQGNPCAVVVMKAEVHRIDALRHRGLHQRRFQMDPCVGLVSHKMIRDTAHRMRGGDPDRIAYFLCDRLAALCKYERAVEIPRPLVEDM